MKKILSLFCFFIFLNTVLTAQVGTGYNFTPSYVNVTGGGEMPDITDGYTCNCDGTGATSASICLQAALDTAAARKVPLLIPYTAGYYKIDSTLKVNCSVIGVGGMPTIKQTANIAVLSLQNNMTGWIHNVHCIGTYGVPEQTTEHAHIIDIGGVNGVTISHNFLENAMGDIISDNVQGGGVDTARNVLITNNTLKNCMRSLMTIFWKSNRWAIMNNLMFYSTGWANVVDILPLKDLSYISNIEFAYNNIQSPGSQSNYYSSIINVSDWIDKTPGGGIVAHHNWGKWGVTFSSASSGWKPATRIISNGTAPLPLPLTPANIIAEGYDAQIVLSWDSVPSATSYNLYRGLSAGNEAAIAVATGITDTTYINTELTNGIKYFYKVAAINANGTSPLSVEVSSIPLIPGIPASPTNLSVIGEYAQASLSWNAVAGAKSYKIYRGTSSGNQSEIATGVTDTTYTNTGLVNAATYFYKIAAENMHGISPLSNEVSATPNLSDTAPSAPTCFAAQGDKSKIFLTWIAVAGATSYNVYRGTKQGQENASAIATGIVTTTYTSTSLTNGSSYYYKVAAVNGIGISPLSYEAGATTKTNTVGAPINSIAIPGNNCITITWTAPAGAASYQIYSSVVPNGERDPALVTGLSSTTTSYTINGLVNGLTYYFTVVSNNSKGIRMGVSNEASTAPQAVTLFAPITPTGLIATAGDKQIVLTWRASQYASAYNVYRGTSADGESAIALATNVYETSYIDKGLPNDIQYFYKVAAVNYIDTSALSNEVNATVMPVSVNELDNNILDIYPNPATSNITVANVPLNANISVFTMDGKMTESVKANSNFEVFDVKEWERGVYIVKIHSESDVTVKKVVVQ